MLPAAIFSPALLFEIDKSDKTVKQSEPFGRVWLKFETISFARIFAALQRSSSSVKALSPVQVVLVELSLFQYQASEPVLKEFVRLKQLLTSSSISKEMSCGVSSILSFGYPLQERIIKDKSSKKVVVIIDLKLVILVSLH